MVKEGYNYEVRIGITMMITILCIEYIGLALNIFSTYISQSQAIINFMIAMFSISEFN